MSDDNSGDGGKGRKGGAAKGGDRPRGAGPGRGKSAKPGKPFTPKSRGMLSHGGAKGDAAGGDAAGGGKPKSYGRRSHDDAGEGNEATRAKTARPLTFDRSKAGAQSDGDGRLSAKRGFRADRKPRADGDGDGARARDFDRSKGPRRDAKAGRPFDRAERKPRLERGERQARPDRRIEADTSEATDAALTMRIARRLARAGVASRRDAEAMIAEGRVAVNGQVLETPALDVGPKDRITVDGEPLPAIERTRLWLFHKPAGLVTTNRDPEGRQTVFQKLPTDMPRVLTIGRLDINTEGLLLLTNDGGLARVLELPATGWLRRYRVRAHGAIDQAKLDELREGIAIDGVFYGAIEASLDRVQGANVWLTLGLREGKNREVKRVLGHLGLDVNRLIRLSYGPFQLADLAEGAVREIHGKTLRDQLGPRLIEEAGADFDAPIVNPFSNKPVKAESAPKDAGARKSRAETAPNKKRQREERRADALNRLETRSDRQPRESRIDRPGKSGEAAPSRWRGRARDAGEGLRAKPDGERKGGGRDAKRFGGEGGDRPRFGERGDDRGGDKKGGDRRFGENKRDFAGDERPQRPAQSGPRRLSNVWIAPGGRPLGPKKSEELAKADQPEKPRALDPTKRMGQKRKGGASGPKRPKKG
ncbi:pseudouridine synthase [Jiella sp. MQZ9-1]|uniref:Pseudouridine synthase n=1 Tax=Jiella flava TaxID=2816857 RepID=A0A939JWB1_9HYPH|nr:pseudouridine synthase [Jiella flava]MBO0662121.1 pseudouridine synthase [Jiella flava]MCD2470550.1 pseudouridine synthase [Jiella flava]